MAFQHPGDHAAFRGDMYPFVYVKGQASRHRLPFGGSNGHNVLSYLHNQGTEVVLL
jgi:hypothetical protein